MIEQLVYVSSARRLFSDHELTELLRKARANNDRLGLTGMLLYKGGNFIQALEGPAEAVAALEKKIAADERHHGMIALMRRKREHREFASWSMGFTNADRLSPEDRARHSPLLSGALVPADLVAAPDKAYKLLVSFKENIR